MPKILFLAFVVLQPVVPVPDSFAQTEIEVTPNFQLIKVDGLTRAITFFNLQNRDDAIHLMFEKNRAENLNPGSLLISMHGAPGGRFGFVNSDKSSTLLTFEDLNLESFRSFERRIPYGLLPAMPVHEVKTVSYPYWKILERDSKKWSAGRWGLRVIWMCEDTDGSSLVRICFILQARMNLRHTLNQIFCG